MPTRPLLSADEVDDGASEYATPALSLVGTYSGLALPVDVRLDKAALLAAAESGDLEAIRDLLAVARLDTAGERGCQALVTAAERGHMEVVRALLAAGASVHASGRDGRQALAMAATKGHTDVVCALLEVGASVHADDSYGLQALHWAAMKGRVEVVKALLAAGASPNCEVVKGHTPLYFAANGQDFGTVTVQLGSPSDGDTACDGLSQDHLHVMQVGLAGPAAWVNAVWLLLIYQGCTACCCFACDGWAGGMPELHGVL